MILKEKKSQLLAELSEIAAARDLETKSTAGDKHETARAHMQIRQEQVSRQLSELQQKITELDRVSLTKEKGDVVSSGSLVITSRGIFFIVVAVGKIKVEGQDVFVVSPQSPIGRVLMGLKANAEFSLNGNDYSIREIW